MQSCAASVELPTLNIQYFTVEPRLPNLSMKLTLLILTLSAALGFSTARAELKIANVFQDRMILQCEKPLPVWGLADSNGSVTVTANGQTKTVQAGADGRWKAVLDPMKASNEPVPFKVSSGGKDVVFADVLVGDVWFAAGQSNMTMPVREVKDAATEIAAANYPQIREFAVIQRWPFAKPRETTDRLGSWVICSPAKVGEFSATGYFFAREVHRTKQVPVGIIHASAGGIAAETLTPPDALNGISSLKYISDNRGEGYGPGITEEAWNRSKKAQADFWTAMESPETNDRDWESVQTLVTEKENRNATWFRYHFTAPETWKDKAAILRVVKVAGVGRMSVNGKKLNPSRGAAIEVLEYKLAPGDVKTGDNTIAFRINGYALNNASINACSLVDEKDSAITFPIPGQPFRKAEDASQVPPDNLSLLGNLFNGMVAPFIPYQIRGVVWYQGESNVGPKRSQEYRELFPALIKGWRQHWEQPELPFCYVQLAGFMAPSAQPNSKNPWAELREAQTLAQKLPATAMAVALDLGEAQNIHPKNKQEVGRRLSLAAFSKIYGDKNAVGSGPVYAEQKVVGDKIQITFTDMGGGLAVRDGATLKGFAIAAQGGAFEWATAQILDDKTVVVSSDKVKNPARVLYGWDHNSDCNLINKAGLPAVPFRTESDPKN